MLTFSTTININRFQKQAVLLPEDPQHRGSLLKIFGRQSGTPVFMKERVDHFRRLCKVNLLTCLIHTHHTSDLLSIFDMGELTTKAR